MADGNFLAFDLGAESGRAVLGTLSGGRLILEEKHRFVNPTGRINGHLHWNLLAQWEELKTGLRNTVVADRTLRLDGAGVDTWGVDFGLISRSGELLFNPFHYRDSRTDGVMDRVSRQIGQDRLFETTGIQFLPFNTLFQLVAMRESNSTKLEAAQTLLFMPDLFNFLFSGVRKSDFSIATTSQMYDPRAGGWAKELLKELELPAHILPEVVPSGTVLGTIRPDVAEECGVGGDLRIIATAGHDTASAVAAVPAEGDDWCYISSGTWSLMGVELPAPIINAKSAKYNYTNEGGVGGSFRLLKNIMGMWLVQECRRDFARQGYDHSYGELTEMAGRAKSLASLIDPDHAPFMSPGGMSEKIERYCVRTNQRPPVNRGEYVRACLDSLALAYRQTLEGLEEILGRKIRTIHIVGGGTRNELLNQMTANACGRTVVTGPIEATSVGNILVQAMAVGLVKSLDEARGIVRNSFEVKRYEPRDTATWDSAYERYRNILAGS